MMIAPVVGAFVSYIPGIGFEHVTAFITEAVGVLGFAAYWWLKSCELSSTGADRLVAKHEVEMVRSKKLFEGHKLRKVDRRISTVIFESGLIVRSGPAHSGRLFFLKNWAARKYKMLMVSPSWLVRDTRSRHVSAASNLGRQSEIDESGKRTKDSVNAL